MLAISSTRGSAARSAAVVGHRWHCATDLRQRVGGRWLRSVAAGRPATLLPHLLSLSESATEELRIRRRTCRRREGRPVVGHERIPERSVISDSLPVDVNGAVLVNEQVPRIEGSIHQGRQADAVGRIEPNRLILAPRDDVGSHQKFARPVQRAMGHASATTTLSTYAHLWPTVEDKTRAAASGMAAAVLSAGPTRLARR